MKIVVKKHRRVTLEIMHTFSAEIGSRGYHVYKGTSWKNIALHQAVKIMKETSQISMEIDPYCCKITITRPDKIGPVTVGHIPRELSRFIYFFLHEGGSVNGTVADTHARVSPIPEGGLEIPILMHFAHPVQTILNKMKAFLDKQLTKMSQPFIFDEDETVEASDRDEPPEEMEIEVESDEEEHGDNTEKARKENNDVIVIE